jgi:hypothetical protein
MNGWAINLPVASVVGWAKSASLAVTMHDALAVCRQNHLAVVQLPPRRLPEYIHKVPRYVQDITLLA